MYSLISLAHYQSIDPMLILFYRAGTECSLLYPRNLLSPYRKLFWLPLCSYSNRLYNPRSSMHNRINSTLLPLDSYPLPCRISRFWDRCRWVSRGSTNRHHNRDRLVHKLLWSARSRCTWQRCRRWRWGSSTVEFFWRFQPFV